MNKQVVPRTKHIAQRTCIACRRVTAKRELVRLVRTGDGRVEVDATGKRAGRGAYLCRLPECWQKGLKSKHLEHALRTSLSQANREELSKYAEEFLSKNAQADKVTEE